VCTENMSMLNDQPQPNSKKRKLCTTDLPQAHELRTRASKRTEKHNVSQLVEFLEKERAQRHPPK